MRAHTAARVTPSSCARSAPETEAAPERGLILEQTLGHIETQLVLVRGRRNELGKLEQ